MHMHYVKRAQLIHSLNWKFMGRPYDVLDSEAVVQGYSVKKMHLKFLQNSQENTCVGFSLLIKLQAY